MAGDSSNFETYRPILSIRVVVPNMYMKVGKTASICRWEETVALTFQRSCN